MDRTQAILARTMVVLLPGILSLSGCVLRGTQPLVNATPVVPPAVSPAPPPPAPAGPLSISQPHPELPTPQPISPEALATTEPPGQPPQPPPVTPRPSRRASNPPPAQPRVETAPATAPPPAAVTPSTPLVAEPEARPPIQEIVSPDESNRLKAQAHDLKQQIQHRLDQAQRRRLTKEQRESLDSITSFVKLSDEAERAGDMRKAFDLAERGAVLAQGLPGAR
jgi:hypothetical protein